MLKTRVTELLGIEYPIIQGGMQWLARAELAAAVSNAGGLGIINAMHFETPEELQAEIKKVRALTTKPFGVNISMLPGISGQEKLEEFFEAVAAEKVPVVETSGRNPEPFVPLLKSAGVRLIHKVPAARYARKAEQVGADAVTIVGFEAAGHPGLDDVPTFVVTPRTAETVKIPVIAAGGIVDARGFVAALALGAEGVTIGTRFLATHECIAHPKVKEWILNAQETDTLIVERSIRNPARVMHNQAAEEVLEMESKGATLEELMTIISGKVGRIGFLEGKLDTGTLAVGQGVGLIHAIKSVQEVVTEIVAGAQEILARLQRIFGPLPPRG